MKVTLTMLVRGSILLAMALMPTLQVAGQGPPGVSGLPGAPGTYPYAPAYYDEPFVGYQSQSALQTGSQRDAATAVLENNIGYSLRAPFGPQLGFDGIFGDRRGIEGNDYSVYSFLPWHIDPNRNVAFVILRGTATDLGDFVGNFGVGQRMYFEDINRIFGWNAWYDLDDSHNQTYHRAGGQLEYMGRYLEVRGGADIVLDTSQNVLRSGFTDTAPFFRGNNVLFTFSSTLETAYDQAYIEAGGPMPYLGRYGVNAYGGAYYLWDDNADDTLGWSVRAAADLTRDVQVGVRHTNDDIFGHNTSVNVTLTFPNGGLKQVVRSPRTIVRGQNPNLNETNQALKMRPSSVASLLGSNVVRDHRTPVGIETRFSGVNAIDPVTGLAVCVIHVDPNAATAGTGTFEDPFRTLEAARLANDGSCRIIRVIPRDDNSGTNLAVSDTFGLFTNQRLLGSSFQHEFETTRGIFELPGFTGSGPGPLVTHTGGGDVIRMGNNTEISGIRIDGSATGNAIIGSPTGFDVNRNEITNALNGLILANTQGIGIIRGNTITDSGVDGVNLTVTGGNQLNLMSSDNLITGSGDDGTDVTVTASPLVAVFNRDQIGGSGDNGLEITSTGMSTVTATLTGSVFGDGFDLLGNGNNGFFFTADSGTANVIIGGPDPLDGNTFVGNMNDGVNFNLTGSALATLLAQNNTTISAATQIGLNFTGTSFGDLPSGFPPDTMGSIGPNHIVELINSAYAIYDKVTGNLITRISDEQFWINSGVPIVNGDTFDPRIIYDPQSGRWFATAIDRQGANSNTIYLAVSRTSDPTDGFQAVQFQADSAGARFNDFDMLGLDADGVYITTNNFNPGFVDTSLYSIPKADLLGAVPSIANLTRIENQSAATLPFRAQPVVDFGPSDGRGAILSALSGGGTTLQRLDVLGGGGAAATLTGPTAIGVPVYTGPVNADQPGSKQNIDTGNAGFSSNVVEVGDSLWAVQSITDSATGNVAIRWYEIDETTNAVLQTGTIADPDLDLYYPSIAASPSGGVLIGYSGSSDNQFVSSYASAGRTSGGVTTFDAPMLLQAGVSDYQRIDGIGRNRWGDYSATVVDPIDPGTFWTFQEFVDGTDSYATQITQVRIGAGGNGRNGINITATGTSLLTSATIDRNTLMDNGAAGLRINADGAADINAIITNNVATRNGTGSFLTSTNGGTINTTVSGNTFDMNTDANTGFHALATGAGSVININAFTNNTANNNMNGNGARFESLAAGTVNLASFTGNTFTGNGLNGTFVRANDPNSVVAGAIGVNGGAVNTFANNLGAGIGLEASNGGSILGPGAIGNFAIVNSMFSGNALGGITALADATAPTLSTLNLTIGGATAGDANTIANNSDVGIGYSLQGNSTGELLIMNNRISDTVDDVMMTTTPFDGQGVYVEVAGTSTLTNSVIDMNMITGNASQGVQGLVREMGMVTDMIIGNLDGDNDNGNVITGNTGDGIRWQRRDSAQVTNMRIVDNTLMNNANGLNLISQNTSSVDTYIVDDNTITMNNDNGVRLRVEADADLDVDMDNNLISMNTNDGIEATESTNTATDSRSLRGTWTNNEITFNGGFGIQQGAVSQNLVIGTAGNGNLISNNQLTGIQVTGPGSADINSNMITMNNLSNTANPLTTVGGIDFAGRTVNNLTIRNNIINNNVGTGVRLANVSGNGGGVGITLTNNTIDLNTGDGLEITNNNPNNFLTITSSLNRIRQNGGRGVDILNQGDADSSMSFNNETVTSNALEGFYVVNSASTNQNQSDAAANGTLLADGLVDATPTLNLSLTNSVISFNGNSSGFDGTGFVLRVGTSDGGRSNFNDPGGFASDGRGGVIANVTSNMFAGNFGDDVIFESFVSTMNPATTGGAWTDQNTNPRNNADDVFTPTGYQSDPLARLDLNFVGNTGDSANVTRFGAFYNNNEPVFKSRTITQDNATDGGPLDDPGPFDSGTRARNAQRLASRDAPFDDPSLTIGASDSFLYPGVGDSTFRRTAASNTAGFGGGDTFGSSVILGTGFGELDFVWGIAP